MSTSELIKAIEGLKLELVDGIKYAPRLSYNSALDRSIDLINTHMEGKVILPVDDLELLLSFAPELGYREGLDPTFYHTLSYDGDSKLQEKVNRIKSMLDTINNEGEDQNG